ncbi:MAG: DNA-directed DNA polymerase [Candidatus Micrarchaeia archaeon]|jgi:DNA polymerase I
MAGGLKKLKATLVDVDYITRQGKPIIRLILKKKRFFRLFDAEFEPYFYIMPAGKDFKAAEKLLMAVSFSDKGQKVTVKRVDAVKMDSLGKERELLKVVCHHPSHVPLLRDKVAQVGTLYEHDIPFARRWLMDKKVSPFDLVELEYEKAGRQVKAARKVGEGSTNLRMMAFDIETYNPKGEPDSSRDPTVMISEAVADPTGGKPHGHVITFKPAGGMKFVKVVETEKKMIEEFCKTIKEQDVEMLLGYNSAMFDLPYLKARAGKTGAKLALGRDNSDFRSRKRGLNEIAKITGRVHIDLYPIVRFLGIIGALKTTQYTLSAVYAELVGHQKEKMIKKIDVWKMWDDAKLREELAEYSMNDAISTVEVGEKVLPMEFEMSRLCGATLFDVCGASASQLVEMLLMRRAGEKNMLIPNRPKDDDAKLREGPVKGAYVKVPQAGIYENLAVLDFRGLYPSIICSYNIDPFTVDCECCKEDGYKSPSGHWFCKKRKGLVPTVLEEIIDRRAGLKKELKRLEKEGKVESEEYTVLFAKSQALKVLANSYYGYLLYVRSRWYSREGGESTTAWGRYYVQEMEKRAEKEGFKVLYMDTDSLFLQLGSKKKEDVMKFLGEVNKSLPEKMELELEGFYPRGLFVMKRGAERGVERGGAPSGGAKKKYALLGEDGRIKIRGFELVRRDWSKIAKDTQMAVLQAILKDGSKEKAIAIVKEKVEELRSGKAKMEDLVIYTRLRKSVGKYDIMSPEVAAVKRAMKEGVKVEEGSLIGYVITKGGKSVSEKAQLVERAKDYDANYYIDHQLLPPVLKILGELGYDEDDLKMMGKQAKLGGW